MLLGFKIKNAVIPGFQNDLEFTMFIRETESCFGKGYSSLEYPINILYKNVIFYKKRKFQKEFFLFFQNLISSILSEQTKPGLAKYIKDNVLECTFDILVRYKWVDLVIKCRKVFNRKTVELTKIKYCPPEGSYELILSTDPRDIELAYITQFHSHISKQIIADLYNFFKSINIDKELYFIDFIDPLDGAKQIIKFTNNVSISGIKKAFESQTKFWTLNLNGFNQIDTFELTQMDKNFYKNYIKKQID